MPRLHKTGPIIRALGPILPGLLIDLLDLITFLHIGVVTGLIAGGITGYWAGGQLGLAPKKRLIGSLIAGIYCALPFTEFIPIGTLVGAYARISQLGKPAVDADD